MTRKPRRERRSYVRAVITTQASIRPLSSQEIDALQSVLDADTQKRDSAPALFTPDDRLPWQFMEDLSNALKQIDDKLNTILNKLEGEGPGCTSESIQVTKTSNISGSGICVLIQGTVAVGQYVKVSLKLPEGWPAPIETYGEVVRISALNKDNSDLHEVGIKFVKLSDEQRERIIAYTFQQQRHAIRHLKSGPS